MDSADEFYDIDDPTGVPVRHLQFDDQSKSLLNGNDGKTRLAIDNNNQHGVLFKNGNGKKDSKNNLFEFDLLPPMDKSEEYTTFLNDVYKDYEFLLKNKQYKHYNCNDEDDEYMQIGVISKIKEMKEEREFQLRKLMSNLSMHLQKLIRDKMLNIGNTLNDPWIINYEEVNNVLNLINAVHFGKEDETIILLQNWIERVEILSTEEYYELISNDEVDKPYKSQVFWSKYINKLTMRGSFGLIIKELTSCQYEELKENDYDVYKLIEDLINLIKSYDVIEFSKDTKQFLRWKKLAVEMRDLSTNIVSQNDNSFILIEIIEIINILSGSIKTIENNAKSWYEEFISLYLYQMPSLKLIKEYINKSLNNELFDKPFEGIENWENICIDLINEKYLTVISSIESLDKSIGTYIAILFKASGLLIKYNNNEEGEENTTTPSISNNIDRMIEDLSMTYLNSNNKSLFTIGVGILINIGDNKSRDILSELLPIFEIEDSDDYEWIISVCCELKLNKTMEKIQEIQGEKFYSKGLLINSLKCFADANAKDKVVSITWRFFEEILINGGMKDELSYELFNNNQSQVENSPPALRQALSPIWILNEIMKYRFNPDKIWINRLLNLFQFPYLPSYYKPGLITLIYDNLNKGIFQLNDLTDIIEELNNYEGENDRDEEIRDRSQVFYEMVNRGGRYPSTVESLIHSTRRSIAMDVSFTITEVDVLEDVSERGSFFIK